VANSFTNLFAPSGQKGDTHKRKVHSLTKTTSSERSNKPPLKRFDAANGGLTPSRPLRVNP
jgi:hypothetical protein